jgi:hypothetical protein
MVNMYCKDVPKGQGLVIRKGRCPDIFRAVRTGSELPWIPRDTDHHHALIQLEQGHIGAEVLLTEDPVGLWTQPVVISLATESRVGINSLGVSEPSY